MPVTKASLSVGIVVIIVLVLGALPHTLGALVPEEQAALSDLCHSLFPSGSSQGNNVNLTYPWDCALVAAICADATSASAPVQSAWDGIFCIDETVVKMYPYRLIPSNI